MPRLCARLPGRPSLLLISAWLIVACRPSPPQTPTPQPAAAQAPDPAALELEQRLAYLEQQLEEARVEAHVPGMAIAIVKDDALIWAKGFGVSDLDANTPVTPETVFAIGSSTKSFSSTLAAMMVDEGKLGWDDPASKHLPGFELPVDGEEGEVATVRDLLAHRSGFARMGLLWAANTIPRERILAYASKAKPVAKLRAEFHYNNVTYMAGALAAASAAGTSWEELLRTRLLEPLHMSHTSIDYASASADPARARGYTWRDDLGTFEPASLRNTDAIAPAGSIFSSVLDMSNWLRLQLGEGEFEGERLVGAATLRETHTQQIEVQDGSGYGMGWMLREWNGERVVEHGGNIDGYAAAVALLPEHELGMVLLTNVGFTPLRDTAMNMVFDALLTDAYLPVDAAGASGGEDLSRFVGEYVAEIPGFAGAHFVVSVEDGKLAVDVPGQTKFLLRPPDPDDEEALREFEATDTIAVSFVEGPDGAVQSLLLHQGGLKFELLRAGFEPEPEVDPSEVRPLLGSYRGDKGVTVEVVIHHGRLALDVPGQMIYDLELPDEKGEYHFRANYDFVVSFTRDASGKVEQLRVVQGGSSGVFEPVPKAKTITREELHRRRKSDQRARALAKAGIVHLRQTDEVPSAGLVATVDTWFDGAGRYREDMQLGEQGEVGSSVSILVDGAGWAESSFDPRKATTGVELQQAELGHPRVFIGDWRPYFDGETVLRSITRDGRELHVVELSKQGLPPTTIHVDAKTGDVVEIRRVKVAGNGMRVPVVVELSDYRVVAGMRVPFTTKSSDPFVGTTILTVLEVETKLAEDPGRFATMPAASE
ncbi:MAG: serine hydrolase domain-containing protein [Enhygromyxa sp.]